MSSLVLRQQAAASERRRTGRLLVDIPVALRTVTGLRECKITNISDSGARLEMETPPAPGVSGWLVMGEDEIYCTSIWYAEGACGIEFEHTLRPGMFAKLAGEKLKDAGPIANRGNIQMGRRRSSLVTR